MKLEDSLNQDSVGESIGENTEKHEWKNIAFLIGAGFLGAIGGAVAGQASPYYFGKLINYLAEYFK